MKKIVVLILIIGLFSGCATSRYQRGDRFLKQGTGQEALKEYLTILHADKRKNGNYTDIRALLGAASSYYQMKKYDRVQRMCKIILKIDPKNAGALFLAGSSLEMLNKKEYAYKFYKQYSKIEPGDPYRPLLEAGYRAFLDEELAQNIRGRIRRERDIKSEQISENSIVMLYLVNSDENPEIEALSKGLVDMIIEDLKKIPKLKVVERDYVQKLMEELRLGIKDLTDPTIVPRFGKLLEARNVVTGGIMTSGADLHITINIVDILGGKTYEVEKYSGLMENALNIQKDIVLGILSQLQIELSLAEQEQLLIIPTPNFEAFGHYAIGLDLMDKQQYASASSSFNKAMLFDPNFFLAKNKYTVVTAISALRGEGSIFDIIAGAYPTSRSGSGAANSWQGGGSLGGGSLDRLNRTTFLLDLGIVPGRETRNEATQLTEYGIQLQRQKLPGPPNPPTLSGSD